MNNNSSTEGALFTYKAISSHLRELGYPEQSIISMERCGEDITEDRYYYEQCACGVIKHYIKWQCNLRTCPNEATKRWHRIRDKYLPLLKSVPFSKGATKMYHLVISPANYNNYKEGYDNCRKSFRKFLRVNYIDERVDSGIYNIEGKNKNKFGELKGWNVHIHFLMYGRRLDLQIRGSCLDCGQNYIKYNKISDSYYCANHNCNSKNVIVKKDSKVVQILKKCFGRDVHAWVVEKGNAEHTLNYLLKYVSADKSQFATPEDMAEYIFYTRKQQLIMKVGDWYKFKLPKIKPIRYCKICKEQIHYTFWFELPQIQDNGPPKIEDFYGRLILEEIVDSHIRDSFRSRKSPMAI